MVIVIVCFLNFEENVENFPIRILNLGFSLILGFASG